MFKLSGNTIVKKITTPNISNVNEFHNSFQHGVGAFYIKRISSSCSIDFMGMRHESPTPLLDFRGSLFAGFALGGHSIDLVFEKMQCDTLFFCPCLTPNWTFPTW